jgi:hypothetical protein
VTLSTQQKRRILDELSAPQLRSLVDRLDLDVDDARLRESLVDALADGRRVAFSEVVNHLTVPELREACAAIGLSSGGNRPELLRRLSDVTEEPRKSTHAEWWLIDAATQTTIASKINQAVQRVLDLFDEHNDENSLSAGIRQELSKLVVPLGDTTVRFHCRNFPEMTEEPATGADGGILATIETPKRTVEKAVLFQAKRLPGSPVTSRLTMTGAEAARFRRQLGDMLNLTQHAIGLVYTRQNAYAIRAETLDALGRDGLRRPLKGTRLVTLGTLLGKWVARCSFGDENPTLVDNVRTHRGFVRSFVEMRIQTTQAPQLVSGSEGVPLLGARRTSSGWSFGSGSGTPRPVVG